MGGVAKVRGIVDRYAEQVGAATGLPTAALMLDGAWCLCTLLVDDAVAAGREREAIRGMADIQTLGALWQLDRPVDTDHFDEAVAARLREVGAAVELDGMLYRRYRVIGTVPSLWFVGRSAVQKAAGWPATFERIALVDNPSRSQIDKANRAGVGIATITESAVDYRVLPRPPVEGHPGLFRWWIAERAYDALRG